MGFIPKGARWYLADLVLEHTIEGQSPNVVHINTHLIGASSPDMAYRKARRLGKTAELTYENTDGKPVHVKFRGLRELNVIHEELADGAELSYIEEVGVPEKTLKEWITPKSELGVFAPIRRRQRPNYMPESVMKMMEDRGFSREEVLRDDP